MKRDEKGITIVVLVVTIIVIIVLFGVSMVAFQDGGIINETKNETLRQVDEENKMNRVLKQQIEDWGI